MNGIANYPNLYAIYLNKMLDVTSFQCQTDIAFQVNNGHFSMKYTFWHMPIRAEHFHRFLFGNDL